MTISPLQRDDTFIETNEVRMGIREISKTRLSSGNNVTSLSLSRNEIFFSYFALGRVECIR